MDSRAKLYKTGGRKDNKLNQRVLTKRLDQKDKRNATFNSHRNINNDLDIDSPPARVNQNKLPEGNPNALERTKKLQDYRLKRNLTKLKTIQQYKVPFHTVVPSGVWLDKKCHRNVLASINLDETPVKQILMKPRSVRKSTVEKVLLHSNKKEITIKRVIKKIELNKNRRGEDKGFNFGNVDKIAKIQKFPLKKVAVNSEIPPSTRNIDDHNNHIRITEKDVEIEPQILMHPSSSAFVFGGNTENVAEADSDDKPDLNSSNSTYVVGRSSLENSFTMFAPNGSQAVEIINRESAPAEMFSDYRNRLSMRIQSLMGMIENIESGEGSNILSGNQKLALEQTKFLVLEKEKKFDSFLLQFEQESDIPKRDSITVVTEEDMDNYWYLVSEEMEKLKKTILEIPSIDANAGDLQTSQKPERVKRRKLKIHHNNSERKRSMRLIVNSGTPKRHNPLCFGCESASKLTPKSASRKSGKKSIFFEVEQTIATPRNLLRRSSRKLF